MASVNRVNSERLNEAENENILAVFREGFNNSVESEISGGSIDNRPGLVRSSTGIGSAKKFERSASPRFSFFCVFMKDD